MSKSTRSIFVCFIVALFFSFNLSAENLVKNGSFEDVGGIIINRFAILNENDVPEWTSPNNNLIEIWNNHEESSGANGTSKLCELNDITPSNLKQVVPTVPGLRYKWTFHSKARVSDGEVIQLKINGVEIGQFSNVKNEFTKFTGFFTATTNSANLKYRSLTSFNQSRGNLIDEISFELVGSAPDVSQARASEKILWPPNHKMQDLTILGVEDFEDSPTTINITSITQDETVDGKGSHSGPDGVIGESNNFQVRAEREGKGDGRVYVISFEASNEFGTSNGEISVCVPRSKGKKGAAVDSGQDFDSTQE